MPADYSFRKEIDPEVMRYLEDQKKKQRDALAAGGIAESLSKIGTFQGQTPQSGLSDTAKQLAQTYEVNPKIVDYLSQKSPGKTADTKRYKNTGMTSKSGKPLIFDTVTGQYTEGNIDVAPKTDNLAQERFEYQKQKDAEDRKLRQQSMAQKAQEKKEKPATQGQLQAATFGKRALAADKIANDMIASDYDPTSWTRALAENPLTQSLGIENFVMGSDDQAFMQAQRDFVSAVLRKESGAAIPPEEMENEIKKYFPVPGDSKQVAAQKAKSRQRAIEGLKAQAGETAWAANPDIPVDSYQAPAQEGTAIAGTDDGKVTVTDGKETLRISREDLEEARKEGFREVK